MNKYTKLILEVIGLAFLICIAAFLYNKLSKENMPDNLLATEASKTDNTLHGDAGDSDSYDTGNNSSKPQTSNNNSSTVKDEDPEKNTGESETLPAMDFTVLNSEGEEISLHSLIGKPIVLNFWASWCSPCKQEFPDFQEAYDKYGSDVEFVMVNLTDGMQETQEKAQNFINSNGYTMPIYYDVNQDAAYTYYVYSIPTTFFINSDGNITAYAQSMLDGETLEKGIGMILE